MNTVFGKGQNKLRNLRCSDNKWGSSKKVVSEENIFITVYNNRTEGDHNSRPH